MDKQDLKERTKNFALRVIRLVQSLPKTDVGRVIGNQLLRSGTAVAANYRAACRARSKSEFIAKIGIVVEESDESCFWMEMIIDAPLLKKSLVENLYNEAKEITAIMYSTRNSAIKNKKS
ncbi:MAG: four helix bundle protein [Candidatus Doudnabacteria bacterium]|jgi:four helix bundle protein